MKHMRSIVMIYVTCLPVAQIVTAPTKQPSKKTIITIDNRLAKKTKTELSRYIKNAQKHKIKKGEFVYLLVKQFPYIHDAHIKYDGHGKIIYSLFAVNPLIRINNQLLLTDKNTIIPQTIFEEFVYKDLNTITISKVKGPCAIQTSQLKNFITQIPLELFDDFAIEYIDHTRSLLRDKITDQCLITFNQNSIPSTSLVAHCKKIVEELTHNSSKLYAKTVYIADVRFKDQIIMRSCMGGQHYG